MPNSHKNREKKRGYLRGSSSEKEKGYRENKSDSGEDKNNPENEKEPGD